MATSRESYALNRTFATRVREAALSFDSHRREWAFVQEVVYSASALGLPGIEAAPSSDASYGDPLVDTGGLIDIATTQVPNRSARVAMRFGDLVEPDVAISHSEMVHLYVRELHKRLELAS